MSSEGSGDRHSKAQSPDLITDPNERAEREARNALQQFDIAAKLIDDWLQPERHFRLRPSMIMQLHAAALDGLSSFAGRYRPAGVEIQGSKHQPVGAHHVAEMVEDMCDYVNANWNDKPAIHLAAFVMWRLNWVHPFDDGNGRTSRTVSFIVLCVRLGFRLPGRHTIPEQIAENKAPYYKALEAADNAHQEGRIDVSKLEHLLEAMLADQLIEVYNTATRNPSVLPIGTPKLH
jgi:Fic family protein